VPDDRRGNYPNRQETYPPSPSDGRTYPSPQDRRETYPTDDYPTRRRGYPSTGDNRSNYPGSNNGGGYGRSNQGNGGWRGNNSSNVQLVYDIKFNANNNQQFYITSENQVITLRGNQGIVVAKITSTNRSNYPYVIYDDQQQIFIDRSGNLFTETGRRIGYITRHT
jgi:hypothetical protein